MAMSRPIVLPEEKLPLAKLIPLGLQHVVAMFGATVLAPVLKARTEVVEALLETAEEVHVVGDCRAPRILFNAVHEAFEAAMEV